MQDFRNLRVWQEAHQLVLAIYRATENMPDQERFGLTSQMRRAAVSIPSNIAEGCGRDSDSEFKRFLQIAMGSASELEYQLLLARDLGMLDVSLFDRTAERLVGVKRMLNSFLKTLKTNVP